MPISADTSSLHDSFLHSSRDKKNKLSCNELSNSSATRIGFINNGDPNTADIYGLYPSTLA